MFLKLVSFTESGAEVEKKICDKLIEHGHNIEAYAKYPSSGLMYLEADVRRFSEDSFKSADGVIFIGSVGIAVRSIAPFIRSKIDDPAVVVVDDTAKYVIPVLSGHIGGANKLAKEIADILECVAVITTATDLNNVFAIDEWATKNNVNINNPEMIKKVSAALLKKETVGFKSDFNVVTALPQGFDGFGDFDIGVSISTDPRKTPYKETLRLTPRDYYIGIGCRMGIKYDTLLSEFLFFLEKYKIAKERIRAIASIDIKVKEQALLQLVSDWKLEFYTFTSAKLDALQGDFTGSAFVKKTTGVDNVCERAACLASGASLTVCKNSGNGVTFAASNKIFECRF